MIINCTAALSPKFIIVVLKIYMYTEFMFRLRLNMVATVC